LPAPERPISGTYRDVAARVRYRHCVNGSTKAAMCSRNHLPPESKTNLMKRRRESSELLELCCQTNKTGKI
jgi:hypothetical protein